MDQAAAEVLAATMLQARVRGRQARARHTVVTAPRVLLTVVLPRSYARPDAPSKSCRCTGIGASWTGVEGLSADWYPDLPDRHGRQIHRWRTPR